MKINFFFDIEICGLERVGVLELNNNDGFY